MKVFLTLSFLFFSIVFLNLFSEILFQKNSIVVSDSTMIEINRIIADFEKVPDNFPVNQRENKLSDKSKTAYNWRPHKFDPNSIALKEMKQMGIPGFIAGNIISYRQAGGYFNHSDDLKKIYGMNPALFDSLNNYIEIVQVDIDSNKIHEQKNSLCTKITSLSLNAARSDSISAGLKVPGFLAGRIVKYRSLLGGFVDEKQLLEVYGFSDSILSNNTCEIVIDTSLISRLSIRETNFKTLLMHPYLELGDVKSIVKMRQFYGDQFNLNKLERSKALADSTFNKIYPYLCN